jgi:hypothetical protein
VSLNVCRYFLPILFQAAGVNSQERRLVLNFVNTLISAAGALISTSLCDHGLSPFTVNYRYRHKPVVSQLDVELCGSMAQLSCLSSLPLSQVRSDVVIVTKMLTLFLSACTAEFGSDSSNPTGANTAIAFICELSLSFSYDCADGVVVLFGFFYSIAYTPLQALYPVECLSYSARYVPLNRRGVQTKQENRAKGMAMYSFAVSCASFLNTYAGPIALQKITWRVSCPLFLCDCP